MSSNYKSLIGSKFGKLEVIDEELINHKKYYKCLCSCGNKTPKLVRRDHLINGDISSCGCNYRDRTHSKVDMPIYDIEGDVTKCKTFDNREFLIDTEDVEQIKKYCWYFDKYGYVIATINGKKVKLHRFLLGFPDSKVDHINRNRADNRKCNLRTITDTYNAVNCNIRSNNSTGVIGVKYCKANSNWNARITVNGEQIFLGAFSKKEDAIKARLEAERKFFKDYAPQKHLYNKFVKEN